MSTSNNEIIRKMQKKAVKGETAKPPIEDVVRELKQFAYSGGDDLVEGVPPDPYLEQKVSFFDAQAETSTLLHLSEDDAVNRMNANMQGLLSPEDEKMFGKQGMVRGGRAAGQGFCRTRIKKYVKTPPLGRTNN